MSEELQLVNCCDVVEERLSEIRRKVRLPCGWVDECVL